MSSFDAKAHLIEITERACSRLMNDLNAVPDDREDVCPGGCARSAVNIAAECAVVNGSIATLLATGESKRLPPDERNALIASYDTKTKAREFLSQETQRLIAVIREIDPETFGESISLFPGRTVTRFAAAELPAFHMSYHDGQICYIQTLYGDPESHW